MTELINKIIASCILVMLCSLWGCGLRGDLYLPEDKTEKNGAPASTEALQTTPGEPDVQGFTADEDEEDDEDEVPDEQVYPDTGMPLEP